MRSPRRNADIVSLDDILAPYYNSISALSDVSEEFEALDFKDAFSEGMVELGQSDGKQYAIPFAQMFPLCFTTKEHFKGSRTGPVKDPETWTELVDYAQKLTRTDV